MSSDAPKAQGGGAPATAPTPASAPAPTSTTAPTSPTTPPTTTPAPAPEPRETTIFVTNKQWECRLQEGTPYLENGFVKAIKGDDNPHHWGQKRFQVYDAAGPGLQEITAGDPAITFYAHSKNEDRKLTLYWVCRKTVNDNRTVWFVFAPNYVDERQVARGADFWGWQIVQRFYAKSKVDSWVCEHCTFLNTRVDDECEMCKTTAPPERKSTPIKRGPILPTVRPPVMARSTSMDSDNGSIGPLPNPATTSKHMWWTCMHCSGENPPSLYLCEFCGKEDYNPMPPQYMRHMKPAEKEDPAKKTVVVKGVSESFGVPVSSTTSS